MMKRLISSRAIAILLTLFTISGSSLFADVDDFELSVRNVTHPTQNTLEFDLYLLDTDGLQPFDFASLQMGLLLNSSIYGVGTLTVSYSNAGSDLDGDQQFVGSVDVVGSLTGYPGRTLIRLMPNSIPPVPPGAGSGTVISSTGDGTLLAHFTITSSVSFTPNTRPDMIFCASSALSPLFPTVLTSYINGNATALVVTPGVDAIVDGNPLLNPTLPALFNVTGTGTYCQGGAGLPVGLDGSEADATYTLYKDGLEPEPYNGTGAALSFGLRTAGTYTVTATNAAGEQDMNGPAVITETILPTATISYAGSPYCTSVATAQSVAITGTGAYTGGVYTVAPAGLTINSSTGAITPGTSTPNSYIVTYTIPASGGCPAVPVTTNVTITALPTASISYTGSPWCTTAGTQSVTLTGSGGYTGGTYSASPAGLNINSSTGLITPGSSTAGTYTVTYTIAASGGCGTVVATTSVSVIALPGDAGTISGPVSFTPGTSGITYSVVPITGASSYIWSYLGTGVTIIGTGPSVTLNFSVSATPGTLSVFGRNSCGDGLASTLALSPSTRTLTLTSVLLEGLYAGAGTMRQAIGDSGPQWPAGIADHITVELHSSSSYATIIYSDSEVELTTSGTAVITIPAEHSGSYNITVKHRNSIETTTATAVSFSGTTVNYSFLLQSAAYFGNMGSSGDGRFLIFSGDVNQDGSVDTQDYLGVDNDAYNYLTGYLVTDVDGNGTVDTNDYIFIDNNNYNYVGTIHP